MPGEYLRMDVTPSFAGQQGGVRYQPIVVFPSHLKCSISIQVFPFSESTQVWGSLLL